ncbi:MAG: 30S ribosomal protein S6 [Chthonomonas sp.]|nr:30S ribosomal protein S6 [Chthonomonas sp.]
MDTRKYEVLYMVSPALADSEVKAIAEKFKGIVEGQGGSVERAEKWEKRKLAYEMAGLKEANYVIMHFDAAATVPAELRRQMRNSDEVIRHIVLLRDEEAAATA